MVRPPVVSKTVHTVICLLTWYSVEVIRTPNIVENLPWGYLSAQDYPPDLNKVRVQIISLPSQAFIRLSIERIGSDKPCF